MVRPSPREELGTFRKKISRGDAYRPGKIYKMRYHRRGDHNDIEFNQSKDFNHRIKAKLQQYKIKETSRENTAADFFSKCAELSQALIYQKFKLANSITKEIASELFLHPKLAYQKYTMARNISQNSEKKSKNYRCYIRNC